MNPKQFDIEKQEKAILEDFEKGDFVSVDNLEEEMQLAREAARKFTQRDQRVNVRISSTDLTSARRLAIQEGIPYQILLASIIHKYVTGRLIEKNYSSR